MSKQWRILVVQDQQSLNRNIVNSLQKDGYAVRDVTSSAEAIRLLWAEQHDIVISDQKMPDVDGFELLQWIRTYCPNTRMIMIASPGSTITRAQALENGVVSYLEKPVDLHVLKEELRRLQQQTGFSASLDSFDLLDVIQIVNMSRKDIALVVNTGLEEQGLLGFREGELIWAEYGLLRGEEAFFALAAHKKGTVIQQPWNKQITPNVTQPLSSLIFQALKYRSKYAELQQSSGKRRAVTQAAPTQSSSYEVEDSPFLFVEPSPANAQPQASADYSQEVPVQQVTNESLEWWQESAARSRSNKPGTDRAFDSTISPSITNGRQLAGGSPSAGSNNITLSTVHKTPAGQRTDLPSWLVDQPTDPRMPALRPSSLSGTGQLPPTPKASSVEWQPAPPVTGQSSPKQKVSSPNYPTPEPSLRQSSPVPSRRQSSPEWQLSENISVSQSKATESSSHQLQSLASPRRTVDLYPSTASQLSGPLSDHGSSGDVYPGNIAVGTEKTQPPLGEPAKPGSGAQYTLKRNYSALVAALQTLGYSIPGFIATAVVKLDGQPVAQVTLDDLDISQMCGYFSSILQGALLSLEGGNWGHHEDTIITSATQHILLRLVGSGRETFQVLITSRESDPKESLGVMANVEAAIISAL